MLVKYSIEYHAMLHFPGEADIGTTVLRIGGSSYTLGQGVFRDDTCIATAEVVTVRLDPETRRPTPLDDSIRRALCEATGYQG